MNYLKSKSILIVLFLFLIVFFVTYFVSNKSKQINYISLGIDVISKQDIYKLDGYNLVFVSQTKSSICDECVDIRYSYQLKDRPNFSYQPVITFQKEKVIKQVWNIFSKGIDLGPIDYPSNTE